MIIVTSCISISVILYRILLYMTHILFSGVDVPNDLPYNDFYEYYAPDFKVLCSKLVLS